MPESQANASPKESELWKPGDPYKYPIPKPDGDPWDVLLQPYLKNDKQQCESWKEDVHNLLIFAGLFSVVMSLFVLHSVQALQLSANDVSANALARIADRLENSGLNGTSPSNSTAFFGAPSRSSVRISILWFIGLVLSISTLIIGIVVLQWIREHQRYDDNMSAKEKAAIFHMRTEALKKWYVAQIVSGLPLLLLFAVVFFFSGVIVYLFTINLTLAITITVFITLTFLFILITTFLPTLQCFFLTISEPSRKKDIPSQCPYKSLQSWIVYHSISWIFRYSFFWGRNVLCMQSSHKSWATFDSWWARLRSTYSQFIHGVFNLSTFDAKSPGFDESRILVDTMQKQSESSKAVLAAYHCFQDVSNTALAFDSVDDLQDLNSPLRKRNQLLHKQYWSSEVYGKCTEASNQVDTTSDIHKLHDENMMLFLWLPGNRTYPDPIARGIASHLLELQSRKLGYTMTQGSLEDACHVDDREAFWLSRIQKQYKPSVTDTPFVFPWTIALHRRVSKEVIEASVEQYVLILDLFFRTYGTELGQAWTLTDLQVNVHGRTIVENFLAISFGDHLLGRTASYTLQFRSTLIFVASVLQSSWSRTERHERHDFLFFAVTYFLAQMFSVASVPVGDEGIQLDLLKALSAYEMTVDKASWTTVFTGDYAIGDWSSKLLAYEARAVNLQDNVVRKSSKERLPGSPTETTTAVQLVKEVEVAAYPQIGAPIDLKETQNRQVNVTTQAVESKTEQTLFAPPRESRAAIDPISTLEHLATTSAVEDHDMGGENTPTRLSLVDREREEARSQDIDVLSTQGSQTTAPLSSQGHQEMYDEQQSHGGGQSGFISKVQSDSVQTKSDSINAGWEMRGYQSQGHTNDGKAEFMSQSGQIRREEEGQDFRSQETHTFEQRQMWLNSQIDQHNSQVFRREEVQENKQAQDMQNLQVDLRNDQSFQISSLQRFEMSEEERRRLEYQESQWRRTQSLSETSETYNSTSQTFHTSNISKFDSYGSSWNQQNHLSWASDATEHNQVDGNLFY